jgi:hypothetical protein
MKPHNGYEICKETGALKSISREVTAKYDHAYVARYENYPQAELSKIRASIVMEYVKNFDTICDVGFGTGAFLSEIGHANPMTSLHGFDVSPYPPPYFVRIEPQWQEKEWDVVTFFDSLEHFVELPKVRAKFAVVSVPWFHNFENEQWFEDWKHRRPGEHLWHFNSASLRTVFKRMGMKEIYCGNPEDKIRKSTDGLPNILTMVFAR